MTEEERKVVDVFIKHGRAFSIGWAIENFGFGEFRFWHENDDLIIMDDEHADPETVKAVLCALVDKAMPLRERAAMEEEVNPYLLEGDELERTRQARMRGEH